MSGHFAGLNRRHFMGGLLAGSALSLVSGQGARADDDDPLPSWANGKTKQAILDFVARVTDEEGKDFIDEEDRIAVFDNDGTCGRSSRSISSSPSRWTGSRRWPRSIRSGRRRSRSNPCLTNNVPGLVAAGQHGLLEIIAATHSGITTVDFAKTVDDWFATAKHPRFDRPYTDLVYQPMIELLNYLRANDFKTFIVSGGGIEFMRQFTEKSYGIPPEQVVGSSGVTEVSDGRGQQAGAHQGSQGRVHR